MQTNRHIPLKGDRALEALVIVGFFFMMGLLMRDSVPSANREMFATGLGTVGALVLLIGKSLWERNGATAQAQTNATDSIANTSEAIAKIPPVGSAVDQPALTSGPSNESAEIKQAEAPTEAPRSMPTIHAPISPGVALPRETEIME